MAQKENIRVCHIYFGKGMLSIPNINGFSVEVIPFDVEKSDMPTLPKDAIFFIELDSLSKERLSAINKLFSCTKKPLAYIFTDTSLHNKTILFKFALFMQFRDILDISLQKYKIQNILINSFTELKGKIKEQKLVDFSKDIHHTLMFCIYDENGLIFASDALMRFLGTNSLSEIAGNILNLEDFILKKDNKNFTCTLFSDKNEGWNCFYTLLQDKNKYILTLNPYEKTEDSKIAVSNRFNSIEWLKDRLIEKEDSPTSLILAVLTVVNKKYLLDSFSYLEYYDSMKEYINELASRIPFKSHITQWDDNSYMIGYVGEKQEDVADHIEIFLEDISQKKFAVKPSIEPSVWKIENQTLPEVISKLDKISNDQLTAEDVNSMQFHALSMQEFSNENEEIVHLLHHGMLNKTPLKLLNIYKGLCIYTNSSVLKLKEEDVYIKCETSQAYAMEQSKDVTIHSPLFAKEIKANINFVNIKGGYAVASGFEYLSTSANNRQYTRVQPHTRTSLFFKSGSNSYQGIILDISLKSIAIECRQSVTNVIKGMKVRFNFRIPDYEDNLNIVEMRGEAEVMANIPLEPGLSKIVLMLEFDELYESYLIRYMYERQKELITELKNLVKRK